MIIDTHSHLNFKAYDLDRQEVIKRTQENELICIDVGTKFETSKKAVELAQQNKNIFASIGMHPIHIKTDLLKLKMDENEGGFEPLGEEFDKSKYLELAKSSNKIVAIGEVGLDYYYKPKGTAKKELFKQKQKQIFVEQLEVAKDLNLPVIVHTRMAFDDTFEILSVQGATPNGGSASGMRPASGGKSLRGVIHCFVGNWQEAQKYLELGFYLGINGVLYKQDISETIINCPMNKIVVETDCPYLIPPEEGKDNRNEPIFVKHVIQKIADLKGLNFNQVVEATTRNARKLFGI
jgi:TatD DNase family protein